MTTYKITHTTTYTYDDPVAVCHNYVMLTPREDGPIQCHSHRLIVRPTPPISSKHKDFFGNSVHGFSIEENHRQLVVTSSSRVTVCPTVHPDPSQTEPWEAVAARIADRTDPNWLAVCPFLFDSPRIRRSGAFAAFARQAFGEGVPILAALRQLTSQVHKHFKYDTTATTVSTPTEDAFRLGRGVCQDYSQVQLACLRSIGIPARYVSGYLRTVPPPGKPRLVGADQSHAWIAAYCGPDLGWIDTDPTNHCFASGDHVTVAWGRDYGDVVPMKGVFLGGGRHTLQVSVDVCPV